MGLPKTIPPSLGGFDKVCVNYALYLPICCIPHITYRIKERLKKQT